MIIEYGAIELYFVALAYGLFVGFIFFVIKRLFGGRW